MSACCRKSSQPREEVEAEEKESPVFETSKITFDQYGNLIYEHEKTEPFDHKKELRTIAELEPGDAKAEGLTWYLMDAP